MVLSKYRETGNKLLRVLLILYIYNMLYIVSTFISSSIVAFGLEELNMNIETTLENPELFQNMNINFGFYILSYISDLFWGTTSTFIAYKFKNATFLKEKESKYDKFIKIYTTFTLALIIIGSFSMLIYFAQISSLIQYAPILIQFINYAMLFSALYYFLVYIPFSRKAFKTYKKLKSISQDEENTSKKEAQTYKKAMLWIGIMASFFILRYIAFAIESALFAPDGLTMGLSPTGSTPSFIFAWIFMFLAYVASYMGYIKPGR
ncbi:MAG: hypothetical protein GY870_22285 [archaeon]|nr:hypothetical protein [archaeon]